MVTGKVLENIRDSIARGHRLALGKGPREISVKISGDVLTVVLEGCLSPFERHCLQDGANLKTLLELRNSGLYRSIPEWDTLLAPLGLRVEAIDGDLDWERGRRVIRAKLKRG